MDIRLHDHSAGSVHRARWHAYIDQREPARPLSLDLGWLNILEKALGHSVYVLEASAGERTLGLLPLAHVRSFLFGRYLVSLPYLNYGGVLADDDTVAGQLIDRAVVLADQLGVGHLEIRQQQAFVHSALGRTRADKVNVRLNLPASSEELWKRLPAKVRNQVRKAEKNDLMAAWGTVDLVDEFYDVFSRNMRDLGTPVYSKRLFRSILAEYPERSEICVVRAGSRTVAAGILLHGWGVSEVPSASSLRQFNPLCPNMLLYWRMLERAIQRGQQVFDFGRSSKDSATLRFKEQWGAEPADAPWQYYLRRGDPQDARRENPRFQLFIRMWQRMPLFLTRLLGPGIIRGIP